MNKIRFKTRFFCLLLAVICMLCVIPCTTVSAYNSLSGGWDQVVSAADVIWNGEVVITADPGEGITVLNNAWITNDDRILVEVNTLEGPVKGYISVHKLRWQGICPDSAYGYVCNSGTTYYSPDYNYPAGSVDAGENVAVLCYSGNWAYIEYNISNGMRKRAFTLASNISFACNSKKPFTPFYHELGSSDENAFITYSSKTVYSGPNGASYAVCGSISSDDNGAMHYHGEFADKDGDTMYYISYPGPTGATKYGYVYA